MRYIIYPANSTTAKSSAAILAIFMALHPEGNLYITTLYPRPHWHSTFLAPIGKGLESTGAYDIVRLMRHREQVKRSGDDPTAI
jgi:hypothetical protein